MKTGTSRHARPLRLQAALLGLVYLAATGAASLHLASTRHAVCAAHGHLLHVEDAHDDPGTAPVHGEDEPRTGLALSAAGSVSHDHCDLDQHRPGDGTEAASPGAVATAAMVPAPSPWPPATAGIEGPAVLSRAPKQSPPAA